MSESGELYRVGMDDLPRAVDLLGRAFRDYQVYRDLVPDERQRAAFVFQIQDFVLRDSMRYGLAFAPSAELEAVIHYLPPGRTQMGYLRMLRSGALKLILKSGLQTARRLLRFNAAIEAIHSRHAPMPHYYIRMLGVEPRLQHRGIGTGLLKTIFERTRAEGHPIYFETHTKANERAYAKLGFETV